MKIANILEDSSSASSGTIVPQIGVTNTRRKQMTNMTNLMIEKLSKKKGKEPKMWGEKERASEEDSINTYDYRITPQTKSKGEVNP